MPGNTIGSIFKVTTFGESHGTYIGAVIDGCPAGLEINLEYISKEMEKRRPGTGELVTSRKESDQFEIISGLFNNKTLGTPICILIKNEDQHSKDYEIYKDFLRPSHADFTYQEKYGIRDYRGGGRASARETAARVAAGAIAKLLLRKFNINIIAFTKQVGDIRINKNYLDLDLSVTLKNKIKCPDPELTAKMIELIKQVKKEGNSIGGVVQCIIQGCPAGLGEPVFNKFDSDLAAAMLSINAAKGFEIGEGFNSASLKGTENNDDFIFDKNGKIKTATNHAGGVLGGITTGEDIFFNVAFKPTPSFASQRKLMDENGNEKMIEDKSGRYDPCVVPRAVAVVEAMAAIVTADHLLQNRCAKL